MFSPVLAAMDLDLKRAVAEAESIYESVGFNTDTSNLKVWYERGVIDANDLFKGATGLYRITIIHSPKVKRVLAGAFGAIPQHYSLSGKLLKRVEVETRKYYVKGRDPKPKGLNEVERAYSMIDIFEKVRDALQKDIELLKLVLRDGVPHSDSSGTVYKAGPFTLINAGGFNDDLMSEVQELVEKASALATKAGFRECLYGPIQIVGNISKGAVIAFYMTKSDDLFIRADAKVGKAALHTVLHELGHRWEAKKGDKNAIGRLYRTIDGEEDGRKMPKDMLKSLMPSIGQTIQIKGEDMIVDSYASGTHPQIILVEPGGVSKAKYRVNLQAYLQSVAPKDVRDPSKEDHVGFVSNYAKTNPSENFAEMFGFYCMGQLTEAQSSLFKSAVFGYDYQR